MLNITQEHTTGKHKAGQGLTKLAVLSVAQPSTNQHHMQIPLEWLQYRSHVAVALSNQLKTVRA